MLDFKKITIEEYKNLVAKSLIKNNKCTAECRDELMNRYTDKDFESYIEIELSPEAASIAMCMNYL